MMKSNRYPQLIATALVSLLLATWSPSSLAFVPPSAFPRVFQSPFFIFEPNQYEYGGSFFNTQIFSSISGDQDTLLESLQSMRVKELKAELSQRNISTGDVFEKDELVKRLFEARRAETTSTYETNGSQSATGIGKEKTSDTASSSVASTDAHVSVPLSFYSMESGKSVAAKNGQNVFLRPSPGQFATMKIKVGAHTACLLVDTACSGIVLRPNVVRAMGLQILPNPISMTTAGGTSSDVGMAQIPIMSVRSVDNQEYTYKTLPIAVQDIGALPSQLDGIIGLSFLSQVCMLCFMFVTKWHSFFTQEIYVFLALPFIYINIVCLC
jgi:hypothetical protein